MPPFHFGMGAFVVPSHTAQLRFSGPVAEMLGIGSEEEPQRWNAAEQGKAGGKTIMPAKSAAARENGKAGGRPRKAPPAGENSRLEAV